MSAHYAHYASMHAERSAPPVIDDIKELVVARRWSENKASQELCVVQSTLHRALRESRLRMQTRNTLLLRLAAPGRPERVLQRAEDALRRLNAQKGDAAVEAVIHVMHILLSGGAPRPSAKRDSGNKPGAR